MPLRNYDPDHGPGEVIEVYEGDGHHGVYTVNGGGGGHRDTPCGNCPWVVDSPVGFFPPEVFRHSARTAYDQAMSSFASHSSDIERPAMCAGFLLRGATHNLAVRVRLAGAAFDPESITSDRELYRNYRLMAIANGVSPDDPALQSCRDSGYEIPGDPCEADPWGRYRPATDNPKPEETTP